MLWLTWQQVYPVAAGRHIDVHHNFAVFQWDLQRAIVQVTEEEEPVGVPRPKLEAQRYDVVIGPARQLQEAGGIEKDREGVGLHAGEGQVPLFGETDGQRQKENGILSIAPQR